MMSPSSVRMTSGRRHSKCLFLASKKFPKMTKLEKMNKPIVEMAKDFNLGVNVVKELLEVAPEILTNEE